MWGDPAIRRKHLSPIMCFPIHVPKSVRSPGILCRDSSHLRSNNSLYLYASNKHIYIFSNMIPNEGIQWTKPNLDHRDVENNHKVIPNILCANGTWMPNYQSIQQKLSYSPMLSPIFNMYHMTLHTVVLQGITTE